MKKKIMVTDELFGHLNRIVKSSSYPDGIVPVPNDRVEGTAFFPGGDGLYGHKNFPEEGVMVLGQDFDNEENFENSRFRRSEIAEPKGNHTWDGLNKILKENGVSMEKCFFTNAIMGLRERGSKPTGRSKAFLKTNEPFLNKCREFFVEQLKAQKPKLIIGLGAHIPKFLSGTSKRLEGDGLSKITSLSKIGGSIKGNLFKDVVFDGITGYKTNVIFITHTSLYDVNVIHRLGKDKGKEASIAFEYKLIKEAMSLLKA